MQYMSIWEGDRRTRRGKEAGKRRKYEAKQTTRGERERTKVEGGKRLQNNEAAIIPPEI